MRVAVVGSRTFTDWQEFHTALTRELWNAFSDSDGPHEIISGGALGTDAMARRYAETRRWPYTEFPADWKTWGKAAGILRNRDIVRHADRVIAFWDGVSRGTAHTIETAKKERVPVTVIPIPSPSPEKEG
jgi:hypothetical protein